MSETPEFVAGSTLPLEAPRALPAADTEFVPVRAMEDIMAARHEQIFTHGHTPDRDIDLPLGHFAGQLRRRTNDIVEDVSCHQHRDIIRRRLVRLGAIAMAMIDRIDAEDERHRA